MSNKNRAIVAPKTETIVNNPATEPTELELAVARAKEAQAAVKALKDAAKGTKAKKENKGVMVTFTNKAGEQITGLGVTYYVVRQGGKLHYKEATAVKLLTVEEIAEIKALNPEI